MRTRAVLALAVFAQAAAVGAAVAQPALGPLRTIERLDVPRYMGTWYEIAKCPNPFQAQCTSDTAAAFSARVRPSMGVSMPVSWEQLRELKSGSQWSIATAREYLSFQKSDLWADYWKSKQTLTKSMKLLGYSDRKIRSS